VRNSKIIKIGAKEVTVRELTVREIDGIFAGYREAKGATHALDLLIDKGVTFDLVLLTTGLQEEELLEDDVTPRELEPLYDVVLELNPSLAALVKKVGTIAAEVVAAG
jgi:hypothetical protein